MKKENYRPFKDFNEAFANSNRIVKHKSLQTVPDTATFFSITKPNNKCSDVEFFIFTMCPVGYIGHPRLNNVSMEWGMITPEYFLENFIFYDTKEPCGVKITNKEKPTIKHGRILKEDGTEVTGVSVKKMTWDEIIDKKVPCFLIDDGNGVTDVGILKDITNIGNFKFMGSVGNIKEGYYRRCIPIDSAIIIQPEYRPFKTFEEVIEAIGIHGQWLKNKRKDYYIFIHHLNLQTPAQMMEMFKGYEFLDGTPFGVFMGD